MKKKVFKASVLLIALLFLLLAGTAVIVTRPFFIREFVLPRVADAAGTKISVGEISFSPFSSIELRDFVVGDTDEPALQGSVLRCRYSLLSILKGRPRVDELFLKDCRIRVIRNPDGSCNLPQALPTPKTGPGKAVPKTPSDTGREPSEPISLQIENITVESFSMLYVQKDSTGNTETQLELADVSLEIPEIANRSEFSLNFHGFLKDTFREELKLQNAEVTVRVRAGLNEALMPDQVTVNAELGNMRGQANRLSLAGRRVELALNVAPATGNRWELTELTVVEKNGEIEEASLRISGTGSVSPFSADLSVAAGPVASSVFDLIGGMYGDYTFGNTTGSYTGRFSIGPQTDIRTSGELLLESAMVHSGTFDLVNLEPMDVVFRHEAELNPVSKRGSVETLSVTVSQNKRRLADVSLTDPVNLSWAQADDEANITTSSLTINVDRMPLRIFQPVLRDSGISLDSGTLTFSGQAGIRDLGRQIELQGTLGIPGLGLTAGQTTLRDVGLRHTFAMDLKDFGILEIREFATGIEVGTREALSVSATGSFDLKGKEGNLDVSVDEINEHVLDAITAGIPEGVAIDELDISGALRINVTEKGKTALVRGDFLSMSKGARFPEVAPLPEIRESVDFDFELTGSRAVVNSLELRLAAENKHIADLTVEGELSDTGNVLHLHSEIVDAEGITRLFARNGTDGKATPAATPRSGTAPGENESVPEPAQPDLGELVLKTDFQFKHLLYGEIDASCTGAVHVENNVIILPRVDVGIGGGTAHLDGNVDFNVPDYAYRLNANLRALDFAPFIRAFYPSVQKWISGEMDSLDLSAQGKGISPAAVKNHLSADLEFQLGSLSVENLPAQKEAAREWKIPELKQLRFDAGTFRARFKNGQGQVDHCEFSGPNQAVRLTGGTGISPTDDLLRTPLELDLDVGVAGSLARRIRGTDLEYAFAKPQAGYLFLAAVVPVRGTLAEPEIDTGRLTREFVTNAGTRALAKEIRKELGLPGEGAEGDLVEQGTGALLRGLGSLLSRPETTTEQKSPPPTVTGFENGEDDTQAGKAGETEEQPGQPQPPREEAVDALFDIGVNILNQKLAEEMQEDESADQGDEPDSSDKQTDTGRDLETDAAEREKQKQIEAAEQLLRGLFDR